VGPAAHARQQLDPIRCLDTLLPNGISRRGRVLQVANTRPKRFGFAGWRLIALTGSNRLRLAT
jgi:hypothetical protein